MEAFVTGLCVAVALFVAAVFWIMQGQIQGLRRYVLHTMRQQHDLAVIIEKLTGISKHPLADFIVEEQPNLDHVDHDVMASDRSVDEMNQLWACQAEYKSGRTLNICYSRLDAQALAKELITTCGALEATTWPL